MTIEFIQKKMATVKQLVETGQAEVPGGSYQEVTASDHILSQEPLMNSEYNSRNVTQEEDDHNTTENQSKVSFPPARFTSPHMSVPYSIEYFVVKYDESCERSHACDQKTTPIYIEPDVVWIVPQ